MQIQKIMSFVCLALFLFVTEGWGQINPTATLIEENGAAPDVSVLLEPGDSFTGAAPLLFLFSAGTDAGSSASLRYEWNFSENVEFTSVFLTRFDAETPFTFDRAGTFFVRLQVTDTENETETITDPFIITVSESELKIPNAFSPNGDGINDTFKVKYKSLVKFQATVFNRWGQKLYQWGLDEIDMGWDGTAHGNQVADGVYYVVVKATGADGIEYTHRGDINILR